MPAHVHVRQYFSPRVASTSMQLAREGTRGQVRHYGPSPRLKQGLRHPHLAFASGLSVPRIAPQDVAPLRSDGHLLFVRFGAHWCGYSRAMAAAWTQLTELYPNSMVDVDCTSAHGKSLCREHNINGFPTILLMERDRTVEYEGARTFEAMRDWFEARRRGFAVPSTSPAGVLTQGGLARARRDGVPLFVRFGAPWCRYSKAMDGDWEKLRKKLPLVVADVDCARDSELCQQNGVQGFPTLLFFKGEHVERLETTREYEGMYAWLSKRLRPLP